MFYCKYCGKNRSDEEVGVYYKSSVKCNKCVKTGRQLKHIPRTYCECGISYFDINTTSKSTHLNSRQHSYYLNSLVK